MSGSAWSQSNLSRSEGVRMCRPWKSTRAKPSPNTPPPLLEIIDGEEEWVVEEILDSKMINQKLCYLVKWEGYRVEHNSWEPWDNVHTPDLISYFHRRHLRAPWQIQLMDFNAITFCSLPLSVMPGHHSLEGGMDVRGHLWTPASLMEYFCHATLNTSHLHNTLYVPPHHQQLYDPYLFPSPSRPSLVS